MPKYLQLIRPAEWVKNVFVLAGLVFSARAFEPRAMLLSIYAFLAFCLAASTTYVINDIRDRDHDKLHPTKRNRPIACGAVSVSEAIGVALVLVTGSVLLCTLLPRGFWFVLGSYIVINLLYTYWLKRKVILDVILIAVGFVLRAIAGGVAISMPISPWLIVCTFTLCMFLGFGKRRCELAVIGNATEAIKHRASLARYSHDLLNHLTSVTAGIAIVTFLLYVMDRSSPQPPFDKKYLVYTLPLVVYAIFRYTMLIESGRVTGPTDVVINDRPFMITIALWAVAAVVVVYWGANLHRWLWLGL
jgi:4-hydroxybenzoate polyprenyltransferase